MLRRFGLLILFSTSLLACAAPAAVSPTAPTTVSRACDVWAREVSFAKSVADHDARAFAEHVLPGAVFVDGDTTFLRGREAIVEAWKSILAGEKYAFAWHPTAVFLTSDRHVAISRGPYWLEAKSPTAKAPRLSGYYQSTWVMDIDGAWRVAIDGGTPPAAPIGEAELTALKASIPTTCIEP
ncbi:MAG: YybH family protein [Polyangiales bacterium]